METNTNNTVVIQPKGYTLEVTSWENDADNFQTRSKTFNNKEDAILAQDMVMTIGECGNNGGAGIGNLYNNSNKTYKIITRYLLNNRPVFDLFNIEPKPEELFPEFIQKIREVRDIDIEKWDEWLDDKVENEPEVIYEWGDILMDSIQELLGYSGGYCRVYDSSRIIYAPEDIRLEITQ